MEPPSLAPQPYSVPAPPPPPGYGAYSGGFDYGAQVCNTPTAAAALSALGGRPRPQATPATARAPSPGDEAIATDVVCNGMLGHLLLKAPPLRIKVAATGEVLGPLDFERVAGCVFLFVAPSKIASSALF